MFSQQASEQIEAIHSMMTNGQRSVYMERHTLFYWGITTAGLILLIPTIITVENIPEAASRAIASTLLIALSLLLVGYFDFRKIQLNYENRAETVSFIQTQITKVWWLLIALIVLLNLAMHFFGGGYMFYGLLLILMGIALYIHGLFSKQMLSHAGIMMILLGLLGIGLRLPFSILEWLSIFCFGIGWPILGLSFNQPKLNSTFPRRLVFGLLWLAIITLPTFVVYKLTEHKALPTAQVISLKDFKQQTLAANKTMDGKQVIHLPAGTIIPLKIELTGDALKGVNSSTLPLELSKSLNLLLQNGVLDGQFKVADGRWKAHKYNYRIRDYLLTTSMNKEQGPQVKLTLHISTNN